MSLHDLSQNLPRPFLTWFCNYELYRLILWTPLRQEISASGTRLGPGGGFEHARRYREDTATIVTWQIYRVPFVVFDMLVQTDRLQHH